MASSSTSRLAAATVGKIATNGSLGSFSSRGSGQMNQVLGLEGQLIGYWKSPNGSSTANTGVVGGTAEPNQMFSGSLLQRIEKKY